MVRSASIKVEFPETPVNGLPRLGGDTPGRVRDGPEMPVARVKNGDISCLLLDSSVHNIHNRRSSRVNMLGATFQAVSGGSMDRLWQASLEQLVVWLALLAALIAVVVYVIGKLRAEPVQQEPIASELISKFRELHSKGQLDDAEFRTIKTTLAEQLQEELKRNGETG
ncbi:MAG: hypothetical protein HQ567_17235 [Candidatus Nealsonbacteria bacterium]|nr:hypothetical protein [Candidatus Nealsonbacteria bacterium]